MAETSTPIASTPKRRLVMTPRRWATLSVVCFLAAAYYLCYEHFPVHVTKDTPLYRVTRNGKQGIVTTGGRVVVPFEWDDIGSFDDEGMAHVVLRQPPIHLNTSDPMAGESVDQSYHGVISCNGKVIIPATLTNSSWRFDDRDELQGVREGQLINFDRFGKEKWRSDWLPADQFQCRFGKNGLMAVRKGDETGWLDRTGKVVLRPPEGLRAVSNFDICGFAKMQDSAGLIGCVDEQGNTVIAPEWNDIYAQSPLRTRNERGIEEPPAFITVATDVIQPAMVIKGAFTLSGHQLIPAEHISLDPHYPSQLIIARRVDGKCGCFGFGGDVQIPFQYEDLFPCGDTLFGAKQGGKYGCINARGKIVVPFSLDEISRGARYGDLKLVFASTGGKWGALGFRGNVVLPFEFSDFVTPRHGKYFVGRAVYGCHLFDASGNAIQNTIDEKLWYLDDDEMSIRWSNSDQRTNLVNEAKCLFEAKGDDQGLGRGVFRVHKGLIVPMVHQKVELAEGGVVGHGYQGSDSFVDHYASFAKEKLNKLFPAIVPSDSELMVQYDFDGNMIWRSDARLFDFLKAFGLSCWGLYCLRSYRVAKREQRGLQAA